MGEKKVVLKPEAVVTFSKWFKRFKDVIENNSDDYAFYRGELYSDSANNINVDFLVSNEDGNIYRKTLTFDPSNRAIYYGKKFSLRDDKEVGDAIYSLVENIQKLSKPVSRVYFDMCQIFREGKLFKDPNEEGSVIIYLIGKYDFDHSMCLSDSNDTGILSKDWNDL